MRSYFQTIIFLLLTLGISSATAYDVWLVTNQNRILVIKNVQSTTPTQELNVTHASVPDAYSHDFGDIGFSQDGSLYGISMTFGSQASLYSIDLNSGAISQAANLFPFEWGNALGFNIATGEGYAGGGLEDSSPYEYLKYLRSFMNHDPVTSQIWHDMSGDYPNGGTAGDFALAHGKVYAIWAVYNGGVYEYYLLQFTADGSSYVNLGRADTAINDPEGIWGLASDGEVLYANSPTALYRVDISGNSASYTKIIDFTLNHSEKVNGATSKRTDLSLTHTVSDASPDLDSNITLTTTVQNDGPFDATSILAKITLPLGYEYLQSHPDVGSYDPVSGEWQIGDLANGTSVTLTMTVTVRTLGTHQSRAEITQAGEGDIDSYVRSSFITDDLNDTIADDDEDTAVITMNPSISVNKQVDLSTINLPRTLTYTIDVINTGNIGLRNITVTDTLPNGQNLTLSTYTGDNDGDNILDESEVWHYHTTYNVTQAEINAGTILTNQVTVTDDQLAEGEDNATTIIIQHPSLTLHKEVDRVNISSPTTLYYLIEVNNTGNVSLTGITLLDNLPNGSNIIPVLQAGDNNNNTILDVGETWVYHINYAVTQAEINLGSELMNQATVTSDQGANSNDSAHTTITWSTPLAVDDNLTVIIYGSTIGNVSNNDTIGSCNPSQAQWNLMDSPNHGSVILENNGTYHYTPQADYNGTDSFTYRIEFSGNCPSSNTAKVSVHIDCATSQASDSGSLKSIIVILFMFLGYIFLGSYRLRKSN